TGTWSLELCQTLGLPHAVLPPLIKPGSELGELRTLVAQETGISGPLTVIAPATHDTASAVTAIPIVNQPSTTALPDWCYLSSGTWSLLGVEVPTPVISAETMLYNFSNEG